MAGGRLSLLAQSDCLPLSSLPCPAPCPLPPAPCPLPPAPCPLPPAPAPCPCPAPALPCPALPCPAPPAPPRPAPPRPAPPRPAPPRPAPPRPAPPRPAPPRPALPCPALPCLDGVGWDKKKEPSTIRLQRPIMAANRQKTTHSKLHCRKILPLMRHSTANPKPYKPQAPNPKP